MADQAVQRPATAARIYDYFLGGTHNFPADREAAKQISQMIPMSSAIAQTNRAFLRRAVRYLTHVGVRQLLDIGSGLPTEGNVHEIAAQVIPEARVVYVDIDPVAVAESQEVLGGKSLVTAIRGDLRNPRGILDHAEVRRLLDFAQPIGLLLVAVVHFVGDDAEVYDVVAHLINALAPGSYLVINHAALGDTSIDHVRADAARDVLRRQTATPLTPRNRKQVERFLTGLDLVEPGVVWMPQWRPAPDDPSDFAENPSGSTGLVGVGRKP